MSRFNLNNGVTHEKHGDGHVIATGDRVYVRFLSGVVEVCSEDELISNPKIGLTRDFNRGKRQFGVFSKKGSRKYE